MKILITGGNGYIAKILHSYLYSKHDVALASRTDLDLTQREEVQHYFKDKYFDIVIHTAIKGGSRLNPLEGSDVILANLLMYDNLMRCRNKFNRLIHFGSGAEKVDDSPYGFSKHIINQLMKLDPKSVNIKIYAVFDENELDTRFIKSNILRYINKEDIIIHQDKQMDFFYMKDLVSLVDHYIQNENLPKEIDCSYLESHTLFSIANMINNLDTHKVHIIFNQDKIGEKYCGEPNTILNYIGLKEGIKEVYNKLKNEL